MFRRNRGIRYDGLIKAGFRPFEARWLSTIPSGGHPALQLIIRKRRKLQERRVLEANRKRWSENKRQRIWNIRTKKMYRRRGWISHSDHPSGAGPRRGEPNPFALYRYCERNEFTPMPGDSRKPNKPDSKDGKRWQLDRAHVLLFRARLAWRRGDMSTYRSAISELNEIIARSSSTMQKSLKTEKERVTRRF